MLEYELLSSGNVFVADVPGVGDVELKGLTRKGRQRMAAMESAAALHRRRYEENPDLLLDPVEYDKYLNREIALQNQSDAMTIQMVVAKWGDRDSVTTLELQADSMIPAVEELFKVIVEPKVRDRIFRGSESTPIASAGISTPDLVS
jgi:hypothetical protein